jgi:hypothetical protein
MDNIFSDIKKCEIQFLIFKEILVSLMDITIDNFLINLRSDPVLKNHLIVKIDEYKKLISTQHWFLPTYLLITH